MIDFEVHDQPAPFFSASDVGARKDRTFEPRASTVDGAAAFHVLLDDSRARVRAQIRQQARVSPQRMFEAVSNDRPHTVAPPRQGPRTDHRVQNEPRPDEQQVRPTPHDLIKTDPPTGAKELTPDSQNTRIHRAVSEDRINPASSSSEFHSTQEGAFRSFTREQPESDGGSSNRSQDLSGRSAASIGGAALVNDRSAPSTDTSTPALAEAIGHWLKSQRVERPSALTTDRAAVSMVSRQSTEAAARPTRSEQTPQSRFMQPADDSAEWESKPAAIFRKLVTGMQLRQSQRTSAATMDLDPPRLGRMRLDVNLSDGLLRVEIQTTNEEARDLLTARLAELKTALAEHGIRLDEFRIMLVKSIQRADSVPAPIVPRNTDHVLNRRGRAADDQPSGERRHFGYLETTDAGEPVRTPGR